MDVLLNHGVLDEDLKNQINMTIDEHRADFTLETMADLAVIFATRIDPANQATFFNNLKD